MYASRDLSADSLVGFSALGLRVVCTRELFAEKSRGRRLFQDFLHGFAKMATHVPDPADPCSKASPRIRGVDIMRDPLLNKVRDHDSYFLFRSAVPQCWKHQRRADDRGSAIRLQCGCYMHVECWPKLTPLLLPGLFMNILFNFGLCFIHQTATMLLGFFVLFFRKTASLQIRTRTNRHKTDGNCISIDLFQGHSCRTCVICQMGLICLTNFQATCVTIFMRT